MEPSIRLSILSDVIKVFSLPDRARILAYMGLYPDKEFRTAELVQVWDDINETTLLRHLSVAISNNVVIAEGKDLGGIRSYYKVYKLNNSPIYQYLLKDIMKWLHNCPEIMADISLYNKKVDEAKNKPEVDLSPLWL